MIGVNGVKKGQKQKNKSFFENFSEKIWWNQIKVVPLHPQFRNDL